MNEQAAFQRLEELKQYLNEQAYKYYVLDKPEISDFEYDKLYRELEVLEEQYPQWITPDSPTQRVGDTVASAFEKVTHEVPLQSLNDYFSYDELRGFDEKIKATLDNDAYEYVVEQKIDGLSVAITYENGYYSMGLTRGDGLIGEDVTMNIKTIASVPLKIPYTKGKVIVRGEVYMPEKAFVKVNEMQQTLGQDEFANPRNAAAGSLRQLDPKICAQRGLDIFIFNLQLAEGVEFQSHSETLEFLREQGFKISPDYKVCKNIEEAIEAVQAIGDARGTLAHGIDGAVLKINSLAQREQLGSTIKAPRWAAAYKYPAEKKYTKLKEIQVQVGRTGVLTPLAILEPVKLAGSTVSKATLHNMDMILSKGIKIGDKVLVQKAGDIIPEILSVDEEQRDGTEVDFVMPQTCPACGANVVREEGEAAYRCTGIECPAQLMRGIVHFASRDAMNIDSLGPAVIEALLQQGLIASIADLYYLEDYRQELTMMERMGTKSVDRLLKSIDKTKSNSIDKLLFGLGIRHIGAKAAKGLAAKFRSIDRIREATMEEILEIPDFGEVMAQSVVEFFKQEQTLHTIEMLRMAGVSMEDPEPAEKSAEELCFAGMTFVLTGTLPTYKRNEAAAIIEERGGSVSSSVSKKTTYVLAGEEAGSKLDKALALGVPVIDEETFDKMWQKP